MNTFAILNQIMAKDGVLGWYENLASVYFVVIHLFAMPLHVLCSFSFSRAGLPA
jgi:hypothetical protein